jgi:acetyl esterase/lipase
LITGAAAAATWMGDAFSAAASPAAPIPGTFDPTPYVNPALRKFVAPIMRMGGGPLNLATLERMRKAMLGPPPLSKPGWTEQTIAGPRGAPGVRIYVINARADGAPRPAILHIHGGGFVAGSPLSSIRSVQEVALALDCVVVSVDYRLAPETRFPGALEDNYAALQWLHANAAQLGADKSRIAVLGESAGGGHAAMLAIAARDRGEIPLAYQALIYPMLDDRTGSTRKTPPYQGALIWTPESNRFGWTSLLGVPAGSAQVPYGSVPARVEDLRGLPPAFIGVGSIDLFVDEDIEYARRLADAGIPVTLDVVPGAFHGFDAIPGSSLAKPFKAALVRAIGQGLGIMPDEA